MERLTKYLASGAADYNYPADCYGGNDCNDRAAKSAYRQTCVERLAAYEDAAFGVAAERLRELAEADKEGRVVVLPCKMGDTVYILRRAFDGADVVGETKLWWDDIPQLGKTVFLTREEAERALEAMKK